MSCCFKKMSDSLCGSTYILSLLIIGWNTSCTCTLCSHVHTAIRGNIIKALSGDCSPLIYAQNITAEASLKIVHTLWWCEVLTISGGSLLWGGGGGSIFHNWNFCFNLCETALSMLKWWICEPKFCLYHCWMTMISISTFVAATRWDGEWFLFSLLFDVALENVPQLALNWLHFRIDNQFTVIKINK